ETVSAHCDGPCGVYDPAQARVHAEAVVSMTKKILDLDPSDGTHKTANTLSRFIAIKEEEAHATKTDLLVLWTSWRVLTGRTLVPFLLVLWTDYFKPQHLEQFPDLHDTFWKAAKLCSTTKVEVNLDAANELLETVKKIHEMFWKSKGKDVPWITAS
ncbi:MAG TPA: superoxide dismutase, Ni, partial [Phycisphaerales bacterium]|nr:superoxide dismutase, Ni [Phycisphaerales bacterium]